MHPPAHSLPPETRPLDPLERDTALAFLGRGPAAIPSLAAALDIRLDQFLEILARPHVAAFVEAAAAVERARAALAARRAQAAALHALAELARDPQRDRAARFHAATSILRTTSQRRSSPAAPAQPPCARSAPPGSEAPAPSEPDTASPSETSETAAPAVAAVVRHTPEATTGVQTRCIRPRGAGAAFPIQPQHRIHPAARRRLSRGHHRLEHREVAAGAAILSGLPVRRCCARVGATRNTAIHPP